MIHDIGDCPRKFQSGSERACIRCLHDYLSTRRYRMNIKAIVHEAEEGGFWAEVPAVPGCATQADTLDELLTNLRDAIEGCLSVDVVPVT